MDFFLTKISIIRFLYTWHVVASELS